MTDRWLVGCDACGWQDDGPEPIESLRDAVEVIDSHESTTDGCDEMTWFQKQQEVAPG